MLHKRVREWEDDEGDITCGLPIESLIFQCGDNVRLLETLLQRYWQQDWKSRLMFNNVSLLSQVVTRAYLQRLEQHEVAVFIRIDNFKALYVVDKKRDCAFYLRGMKDFVVCLQ
jgi:hypothetical protein